MLGGAWGNRSDPHDKFENGKMVHSNAIWSALLELQRQLWKQDRACVLTLFETICNFRETNENYVYKACILILKQFGIA